MALQMILCLETNKRAHTDYIYIKETMDELYEIKNNEVKISPIYMGTKTKYRSKDVLREIKQKRKLFTLGPTKVIYCIDTDEFEKNPEHKKELCAVRQFCEKNEYDLIWFCHEVEEVFLGKKVPDSQKVKEASGYRGRKEIRKINLQQLNSEEMKASTSNILCILDQYLKRK